MLPLNIDRFNTSGLAQFHQLDKHYRECGGKLQKTEGRAPVNKCTLHIAKLKSTFVVGVAARPQFSATLVCGSKAAFYQLGTKGIPYGIPLRYLPGRNIRRKSVLYVYSINII